jgi:hypothetical protein
VADICDVKTSVTVGTRVSFCPADGVVGTCAVTWNKCGATGCTHNQRIYSSTSMTCESAKQICNDANTYSSGELSSTFVGSGCGTNAGAFSGVDVTPKATTESGQIAATCILSSGAVTSHVPCHVSMYQLNSLGPTPLFSVSSDDSGHAFSFLSGVSAKTETFTNDGLSGATCDVRDGMSRQWSMHDQTKGQQPKMGSYTLRLTEVTSTGPSYMGEIFSAHGSLDVSLDPFTMTGATGTVSAHVDF